MSPRSSESFPAIAQQRPSLARVVGTCSIAILCWALATEPGKALDAARPVTELPSASLSSGLPWSGRLVAGVRLRMSAVLRPVTEYARSGNFYGTAELVGMLERTAHKLAASFPGSQLSVGELSGPRGGKLDGHRSHRNGRDVDVAFLMNDAAGQSAQMHAFITFNRLGDAVRVRDKLSFDDAKNWALVASMLRDPEARVQHMFVSKPIRKRLLQEGERQGESAELLRVAAAVLVQPRRGHRHANHFHVRIYCASDDRPRCKDRAPYWPWYEGPAPTPQLAAHMPFGYSNGPSGPAEAL